MNRRLRMSTFLSAGVLAATALVPLTAVPAQAWPNSGSVLLNGRIGCNYSTSNTVKWAWVSASNGESGWASLGSGGMTRSYKFQFNRVPTSTMTVTVKWGCATDGEHSTRFGVNRPATGTTATRNICYWSPCWI
ncbi:hypothetical protein [Streptomyces sp. NBC_01408]|uniref:hypothetical protein n=1 Tax=Streptomyces sp. NBC_01408 TaxID=2903855 RepID=UPI002250A3BE|nr:hypothetical protein [Streptomyces sp. NBC_01408]MCX4692737.1 hypothetical protein [Streptomyces sp. NBC_01408]